MATESALPLRRGAVAAALAMAAALPIAAAPLAEPLAPAPPLGSPSAPGAEGEVQIVEVRLNGVAKGEFMVLARPDGDYLVAADDLLAMQLQTLPGPALAHEGRPHHSLRALGATVLRFDAAQLVLHVELPPRLLPSRTIDFQAGGAPQVQVSHDNSAFLNYRVQHADSGSAGPASLSLATELGVRIGDWLLHSESLHVRGGAGPGHLRTGTSLSRDDRGTLQRWVLGDFTAVGDALGTTLALGGIGVSKDYRIDPYFVRQPLAGLVGTVAAPAQAEIYLDGARIGTETLQPGPFELRNISAWGGRRDVTVVIRDSFGREQRIVSPYYFTPTLLREGLHEYAYGLGRRRLSLSSSQDAYGGWVASAVHRYGLSDALTLGAHAQAEHGRHHLGPTLAWRSNRWGVVSGSLAHGRSPLGEGWAGLLRHGYQSRAVSTQLELLRHSPHYQRVGAPGTSATLPARAFGAGASGSLPGLGNLSLAYRLQHEHDGEEEQGLSLGLSRRLLDAVNLLVSLDHRWGSVRDTRLLAMLSYSPRQGLQAHFSHLRLGDGRSELLQLGAPAPLGEGVGYRLVGERSAAQDGDAAWYWSPALQYNGRRGSYGAEWHLRRDSAGRLRLAHQLSMAGGVAYVGGMLAFSRPISDAFASVQVGTLEGVRVYQSSEAAGRTDARGRLFLPNLGAYIHNRIAIDDRDIPIDYRIAQKELFVSPPQRGGAAVRFDVARNQVLTGRLLLRRGAHAYPAAYGDVQVKMGGRAASFPTGADGEFYIDGLMPGRHAARLQLRERRCEFELIVPESLEMMLDLGELHACRLDD